MVLGLDMRFLGRKWQKKNVKDENKGKNSIASAERSLARVGCGGRNRILVLDDVGAVNGCPKSGHGAPGKRRSPNSTSLRGMTNKKAKAGLMELCWAY
jgi:hypothetical protein